MSDFLSSSSFRFTFPWALLLLLVVPWSMWLGLRVRSLSRARRWTAVILRSMVLVCLVVALAGIETVSRQDHLAVFFLLDQSSSIGEHLRKTAIYAVNTFCAQFQTGKDLSGVIAFGEEPSIELGMGQSSKLQEIRSFVGGEQTNIAAAIRLAIAAFPKGTMKRIVLLSDGNETRGHALDEARIARAEGIAVDVFPLVTEAGNEVRIKDVTAPNRVKADEPFQLRVVVQAEQDCEATLKIFQRLQEGRRPLTPRAVTLQKGDNVFLLTQELHAPGFYEYEVTVDSDADTIKANNEGHAFTMVQGEPVVLYVEADPAHSVFLRPALESQGLRVVQTDPAGMPMSLAGLAAYDAIVLSNVSSTDLNAEHLKSIETAVRDLGIGLVMIGGPDSFGAGGFLGTPVEAALPVDMDIKQRKTLPRGALVLIMHTCEIPEGNVWAREIGLASLNVLASQDLMGALGYLYGSGGTGAGHSWIFGVQQVGDKTTMRRLLTKAAAEIGDMPDVGTTLRMAYDGLLKADAAVKRVVIISDGDPAAPTAELLGMLKAAEIAVSTVCIAPHSPSDTDMLKWIAGRTGGQFYHVTNPQNLPQIFTKEAAVVRRGILVEEPFSPRFQHDSEVLSGLAGRSMPPLRGYVVTTRKDTAVVPLVSPEDDPVLAHWRYGLGKSVAFTSDVTSRWAADWLGWEGFNRFWAQAVRWAMREIAVGSFRVDTSVREGMGRVRVDAVDQNGRFVNFLRPRAVVSGPAPEFIRQEADLTQTGPGIYEASFPLTGRGAYMVNVTYVNPDGSSAMIPAGLSLGYSREYERNTTDLSLLKRIAATADGRVLSPADNPFTHDLVPSPTITPVWHYFVVLAVLLFPVEIFVRRVVINVGSLYAPVARLIERVPVLRRIMPVSSRKPLPITGRYTPAVSTGAEVESEAVPGSFGAVVSRASQAPRTDQPVPETTVSKQPETDREHTKRLLDAKKRAMDKRRNRSAGEP